MKTFLLIPGTYLVAAGVWILLGVVCFRYLLADRRKRRKNGRALTLNNFMLSVWLTLAILTVAEFAFAVLYDETDSIMLTNASKRWVSLHVKYNDRGFRDPQLPHTLPEGHKRIAFVGDSFTFGHGVKRVEDRFTDILKERVQDSSEDRVTVANLSVLGADIDRIVEIAARQFEQGFQMDTVVFVFCLNDIERFQPDISNSNFGQIGQSRPEFFLFRDTYLFNFLYFRFQQARLPAIRDYFGFLSDFYNDEGMVFLGYRLEAFRYLCNKHNAQFRVVIFPFVHNLGPDYPFADAHQRMADLCKEKEIPFVDLREVLEPHKDEGLTVNPYDAHPNELANELAADAIFEAFFSDVGSKDAAAKTEKAEPPTEPAD